MAMKKWLSVFVLTGLVSIQAYAMMYVTAYQVNNERSEVFRKNLEMAIDAGKKIVFESLATQALALGKMRENRGVFDSYFLNKLQGAGGLVGFDWLANALVGVEALPQEKRPAFEEKIKAALEDVQAGRINVQRAGALVAQAGQDAGLPGQGAGQGGGQEEGQLMPPAEGGDVGEAPVLEDEPVQAPEAPVQKKPAGPQVLSPQELAALSPAVKAKSDALFIEKLREVSKKIDFSKTWQALFDESMQLLQEIRKNKDFFQRDSFDTLFKSTGKEHKDLKSAGPLADIVAERFVRAQGTSLETYLGIIKNDFMQGLSAGSVKAAGDLLKTCLFDPGQLTVLEEDLVRYFTTLVMLMRGQEPDATKLSTVQKFKSDSEVVELFKRFAGRTGSFSGKIGKDLLKQFTREVNLLRITPQFLKYQKLSEKGKGVLSIMPLDLLCDAVYGAGEIRQGDLNIFKGVLFNPEENKQYVTGDAITKDLVVAQVFNLNKAVENLLKSKTVRDLITQLPFLEKGLAADFEKARVITGLSAMIKNNDEAQKIVGEFVKIAGWVQAAFSDKDQERFIKIFTEGRANQELADGVKAAFVAVKKKLISKPKDDLAPLLYSELVKVKGINKEVLREVFASPERTLEALKELFTRTMKIKGLDTSVLVQLNKNIRPLGIVLQSLKALPTYAGTRTKQELLSDVIEVLINPTEKLKYEEEEEVGFDPILNNKDEISGGWVFRDDFEQIKTALKSKNFATLEKAFNDFVASCGLWAQSAEDKAAWDATVVQAKAIIKTALQSLVTGIPLTVIKELENLSQGDSELNGKPIVPELMIQEKGGYDRNKLIIKILDSFKVDPLQKIIKDVITLVRNNMTPVKLKVFDTTVLQTKCTELMDKLAAIIKPQEFADPLRQETLNGIRRYFDNVKSLLDQSKGYLQ